MYEEYSMDGIEDLLNFFDLKETEKVIRTQILNSEYGITEVVDYYRPYYAKYQEIQVDIDAGITEDIVRECKQKAKLIALMFISAISEKFNLSVDEDWLDEMPENELQAVTLVLYSFFVLNLKEILLEVMTKYIDINHEELAQSFDNNPRNNKDATFGTLKKNIPMDFTVIGSNIYDVCYAKGARAQKEYIDYIDEQYNSERLTGILCDVTDIIGANVLNISKQDYDPQGASVTLLISEKATDSMEIDKPLDIIAPPINY